jgi:hypothetical protein
MHESNAKFGDLAAAAKWSLILFVPWIGLTYLVLAALGGLHGWGGVALIIAEAPLVLMEFVFHFNPKDGWASWVFVGAVNWIYFFLLVMIFRFLYRMTRSKFS